MIPVMIVEDEFLVRAGLRTCIDWEKEGFEIVAEAGDGQEALALYEKYHPAIVITDIRLPKMDGIHMMKALAGRKVSFIVISAYDDFQYAKESISIGVANYFLKGDMDREELLETLRSLKSRYAREEGEAQPERTHTIKELYLSPESVLEDLAGVPENGGAHLLYYTAENANTQMLDAMVSDFFFRSKTDCIRLESEKGSWFLYASGNGEETVRELSRMFERYVEEEIVLASSRSLDQYPDIKEAVYHVLLVREQRAQKERGRTAQKWVDEGRVLAWIRQTETELMGAMKFHKYDEAAKLLAELRIAMIEGMSPTLLFDGVYRLLGCFTRCNEEIHAARTYSELMESLDLETIFDTLAMYVDEFRGKREDNGNTYILRVKEYVEKHYQEPILIRDLSDYVHVSPNYLGKIFYLNTGEYLKDYINSVKMEKAKELLLTRRYPVSEVADMVGMEDQRYFSKLFKKHCGVSPKEFGRGENCTKY